MSLLSRFRLSPRWLILLIGFIAVTVTTVSLLPHDDGSGEDRDCLVCKAGHQPLTELALELVIEPPAPVVSNIPEHRLVLHSTVIPDGGNPRAPPV